MTPRKTRSGRARVVIWRVLGVGFLAAFTLPHLGVERASADLLPAPHTVVCKGQTYALCAAAKCNVYDGVAYCQCEVKSGDSISLPFQKNAGGDVCAINAAGAANHYMVSTFSMPESIVAPKGDRAIYTCSGVEADGAYAQCDGGLCFASTEGAKFPGFDKPVPKGQVICSCPITTAKPVADIVGHQILGPYPCDKSFFKYCRSDAANGKTGSTIYVGAPKDTLKTLTVRLDGSAPAFNECHE